MWFKDKRGATEEFSNLKFFFFVYKMYANCLEVQRAYKYTFWLHLGAMSTKRKLSSADHVTAIGKNPRKMAILYPIFIFLVFLKNYITFRDQRRLGLENTVIKACSCKISWR